MATSIDDTNRTKSVLDVENLAISFKTRQGANEVVRDLSIKIEPGRTLGLVGESGCGKSTTAFGIIGFLGANGVITNGAVKFQGVDLVGKPRSELRKLRGSRVSMVYQDPMQALNPSMRIGQQLTEVLTVHKSISKQEAYEKSIGMLKRVHMPDPEDIFNRYPHQLSGGQQQRVVIAMAMLNNPDLLIMDEPTTALDVTVEAAVLDLVHELKKDSGTAILFITHNLGVIAHISDDLCVMYAGQVVEQGATVDIFHYPAHPYTQGLLSCVPKPGQNKAGSFLVPIRGQVPPPADRPDSQCIFAPRCDYVQDVCFQNRPELDRVKPGHTARCFFAKDISAGRVTKKPAMDRPLTPAKNHSQDEILKVEGVKIYYPNRSAGKLGLFGLGKDTFVQAVDGVGFTVKKGRVLGLVGESGCGKSTLARGIIGLEPVTGGRVDYLGFDINQPVSKRDQTLVRGMQMVFQNPDSTLNPFYSIGRQIARPIKMFKLAAGREIKERVLDLLNAVRLDGSYYDRLPVQLSGGEKQRVGIARALATRPDLVICDEPVSALDVSVQASILNLLSNIQSEYGAAMIFIAHDLSVIRFFSDDTAVMYLGQIVEIGSAENIYAPPYHPYTEALLSAAPAPDPDREPAKIRLEGEVPSALSPPSGCRFHTRCPRRKEMLPEEGAICITENPPWRGGQTHRIFCHIPLDDLRKIEPVIVA